MEEKSTTDKISEALEKEKEEFWKKREEESEIVKIEKAKREQNLRFENERKERDKRLFPPEKPKKRRCQYL